MSPVYEHLKVERRGRVGWLINNRPDQLNAMNAKMRDEFADAWLELDRDPQVRVIVHTGEGRAFQTGVDVTEIASDGVGMQRYRESLEHFDLLDLSAEPGLKRRAVDLADGRRHHESGEQQCQSRDELVGGRGLGA